MDVEDTAVEAGWEVRHDEASGQVYYWNVVTGETSWEPPPHLEGLPRPWSQAYDDNDRVYYLNTETMETRWTPPPSEEEQLNEVSDTDVLAATGGRGRRPSTAEQMTELNRLLSGEGDEEEDESPEGVGTVVDQQEASEILPSVEEDSPSQTLDNAVAENESSPWMMFVNEDDGIPYYYNHITGECLWDPPEEFLRFHQEQHQEQEEGNISEETTTTDVVDAPGTSANSDDNPAPEDSDSASSNDALMQAAITPEFEEKVRQAIAAVSKTPVGSSRLVLVHTPTQQQLVPRTGRSTGGGVSTRSIPNSSRPHSGSSRPSSGGAVSRPRTAVEGVASSRFDPLPIVEVSTALKEEIARDEVFQGEATVAIVDEVLVTNGQSDEGQFCAITQAEKTQQEEVEDNSENPKFVMSSEIHMEDAQNGEADAEIDVSAGVEHNGEEPKIDMSSEIDKEVARNGEADANIEAGVVDMATGGLDVLASEESARTALEIDMATEVDVADAGIGEQINASFEGEIEAEANVATPLTSEADSHFEEADEAALELSVLSVAAPEINARAVLDDAQYENVVAADEMLDEPPFRRSVQLAAITLQCMMRCIIARRCVKHKREVRDNVIGSETMEITPGRNASAVSVVLLPEEQHETRDILPSFPTRTVVEEQETTPADTAPAILLESNVPDVSIVLTGEQHELEVPPSSPTQTEVKEGQLETPEVVPSFPTPSEVMEEEIIRTDTALSLPSVTEAIDVNHESLAVLPPSDEVSSQFTIAQSDLAAGKSIEMPPSAEHSPVSSSKTLLANTPPQEQRPRDAASLSTRQPSVLDVTTFFPQRRSLKSSQPAHTGSSSTLSEPVAITRKKVDIGSPPRVPRASQQALLDQQRALEVRKKEEERAQRAQVLEYQRIYADSRKAFKTEKQRLLDEKLARDNQRQHDAEDEKQARIRTQRERDEARARKSAPGAEADRLLWNHLKTQGRPTEQSVNGFREALANAFDSAQFPNNMCAERARELHERIKRLHRATWGVDSQLEAVELRLLSELHPLTDRQRPLQAKYAAKLRCLLEQMLNTVQSWRRVLDDWEAGEENGSISRYWSNFQARYSDTYTSDESRRQCILNEWRGAAGGDSLLHVAAWNGWEEHVRLLLDEGADVNLVDSSTSHRTALHEACRAGNVAVVELLLRSGARLSCVDVSGDSALHVACRGGWTRVVRVLLIIAIEEDDGTSSSCLTLEAFFNLPNGKGRRAVEVATLPSLMEELERYDYQLNSEVKQRHVFGRPHLLGL